MVIRLSSICSLWVEPYSWQFLGNIICSETCSHLILLEPALAWLSLRLTSMCTSLVPSPLLDISVLKEGNVLRVLQQCARWLWMGGEKWVCQERTSKELWMNEVWQNCAKGVFVERILSVLCIFLLCLSPWIEVSSPNYQLLHDSSMFVQPVQSGICLSIWWQECSLFWSL